MSNQDTVSKDDEKIIIGKTINRRSFLKASATTAAVTGATLAVSGPEGRALNNLAIAEPTESTSEEQIFSGACRGNCAGGCFLNIHVRNGKIVQTTARDLPNPAYNRICSRGLTHVQRVYHPDRLKYPMKRAGARGAGKWERISWDEALTTITDKWKYYTKKFGKESFSIANGSGSYATLSGMGLGNPRDRLRNVTGAANIALTVDAAHGYTAGYTIGWGPNFTFNELADLTNAKTIICWGSNPAISQPHNMHFITEARRKGAKFVVIDPVYSNTATKADEYLPIRPGSDGALALAMMNIVIREGWQDTTFLKNSTVAPFLVKASDGKFLRQSDLGKLAKGANDGILVRSADGRTGVMGTIADPIIEGSFNIDGIKVTTAYSLLLDRIAEFPPEKASEICGLSVSQIEEITKLYATNTPSTIYTYFGVDHWVNAHYSLFSMYALAMITGNMGKPGASCGMGETLGINFINIFGSIFPQGATGPSITVPATEMIDVMKTKTHGTKKNLEMKGVFMTHRNAIGNDAERKATIEWMSKMEFIAVADMNMNETAQYADILLPVAHWFELEDAFCAYSTHPYVLWQEKAIEPLYECKSDFEICNLLAKKLGVGKYFNMNEKEYIDLWLDSDGARALGITQERLRKEKAIKCMPGDNFVYGEGGVFWTPTGRAHFYQESPVPNSNYDPRYWNKKWDIDKERLPTWVEPAEGWHKNPLAKKFPFVLISEHVKFRTHTQWWDVPALAELDPEPLVKLNSDDARKYGIKQGDKIKLHNDRGYVVMKAIIHEGAQPGVLVAPKGWEKHQFIDGHFSDLTSRVTNEMCANSAFFDVLVGIEKL